MSDGHTMSDTGNMSLWPTEPPTDTKADMTNVNRALTFILFLICLVGLVGNGLVLWFLFFRVQKNNCVIYIINLAIADTIFLVGCFFITVLFICVFSGHPLPKADMKPIHIVGLVMYSIGFNTSSFVLVAISMERCLSVCSTMWYHRQNLKKQYIIVCALLWALSCLVTALELFVCENNAEYPYPGSERCTAAYLFTSALYLLAVILMIFSSGTLLIAIQKTSNQCHPIRLYIIVLLTVLIFHLSVVPARVLGLLLYFKVLSEDVFLVDFMFVTVILTSIYCTANPYVYIFVGIWRRRGSRHSIQQALQNIFKEDRESSIQKLELTG